jgi:small GTP-binding protein
MKVVVIGDAKTGKTSLILRFALARRPDPSEVDKKVDFKTQDVELEDSIVQLKIMDAANQVKFDALNKQFY